MANTVNDVMNVIASPDYGIKNIAGTNQEILAILQGTHSSKNNIYNIVDDIKNLLQNLVDNTSQKNKPIDAGKNSTKINRRHIQDILDETKGIRKSIDNLSKAITKQRGTSMPAVAKLSNKASDKVAQAMIKSMDKQNKGGRLSAIIDSFKKLKDISLKDFILGKQKMKILTKIFKDVEKDLKVKKKDLDNVIRLVGAAPEMINALNKIGWKINRIIKNKTIKKLSDILIGEKNSILSISVLLVNNKKIFENANKISKSVSELSSSLAKSIFKLFFASLFAKKANKGIKDIDSSMNKLFTLSKKLTTNKKNINDGAKVAKKITALVGNLLLTSIFLTIAAITGGPAILGAKLLSKMVDKTLPIAKKLSKNNKHIGKAIGSALILTAFTGLMAVSSVLLATIAVTGVPALLGSVLMMGIVKLNIFTCKMISKSLKTIVIGSIGMSIMSVSLLLFGIALGKITNATKGVGFKQVGVIAALTVLLGGSIALLGIPAVFPFIALGSISMAIMSVALIPYGIALNKLSKASKNLKMKNILKIAGSMIPLGLGIAAMAPLTIPITLGSIAVGTMIGVIRKFTKTLERIKKLGEVPTKIVYQLLNSMKAMAPLGLAIAAMAPLTIPISLGSIAVKKITNIVNKFINTLEKIKKLGTVPTKLVYQTLNSMGAIGNFFRHNMLKKKAIKSAKRYKKILRPFGNTLKSLIKLKELGVIPMKLVYQTLNAMSTIANYYIENRIRKKAIKQAKRYKKILRPFGNTLKSLIKLKELGVIPMKLVYQTLNAMSTIANYYIENPIKKKAIKQARRYKRLLKPFGKTIEHLFKLKELGAIPTNIVKNALISIKDIMWFYSEAEICDDIELKSETAKIAVNNFANMSTDVYNKLSEIKEISFKTIFKSILSMKMIIHFMKWNSLTKRQQRRAKRTISILKDMTSIMSELSTINSSQLLSVGESISNSLSGVESIDISKVQAVTDMFNAFNGINKSESIINKFTETVKEFTKTCKDLMDAMGDNTNAINNIGGIGEEATSTREVLQTSIIEKSSSNENISEKEGIRISNVDEIARTIAEKINGALSIDVPDTQVQLLINGMGGNEWTISRY